MSAPERIWARPDPATVYMDGSSPLLARDREFSRATEYVRVDVAERQLAEARDLLDRKVNEKIAEVHTRKAAEAERDRLAAENEALRDTCERILPYLRWTIGDESPGHHPTMPSAVRAFESVIDTAKGAGE